MAGYVMPAGDAATLMRALGEHGVDACVGGGWAVDALLGKKTREHSDLDLWLEAPALEGLFRVFVQHGLDRIFPWPGDRPWNFVLHDGQARRADLHVYETLRGGEIQYGSVLDPFILPAEALSHRGVVDGFSVRCEEPTWAVSFHTGYLPRPSDHHDVKSLCDQFDIELPDAYR
jgi:lincosamide nucleotidyltransferase A/C/D/E